MKKVALSFLALAPLLITLFAAFSPQKAQAVPSYARQTGLPCSGCHYTPPELNPAGRRFKLLGYVDRDKDTKVVKDDSGKKHAALDLLASLPLSAMLETSFTAANTPQPGTRNGTFELPQDISLFLSGAWTSHIGSFVQVTYDKQDDHFSIDNTDIRYANLKMISGKEFVYGVTLNNNPTVEDLWNDTPAFGFPWISDDFEPTPTASPFIRGLLAQDVAGVGGYAMWDKHLYVDATIYASDHVGISQPNPGTGFMFNIRGIAPYWRVAWQQETAKSEFEVGTYGMHLESTPNAITGFRDAYTDWAVDLQYDRTLFRTDVLSLRGTYIGENSTLAATFNADGAQRINHYLGTATADAEYHFGNHASGTFGWFDTGGTVDPTLYSQTALTGSANGNPRSAGFIGSFSFWPMQNIQLAAQYTGYTRFNGAATNYDGAGRNASDNNVWYLLGRFVF